SAIQITRAVLADEACGHRRLDVLPGQRRLVQPLGTPLWRVRSPGSRRGTTPHRLAYLTGCRIPNFYLHRPLAFSFVCEMERRSRCKLTLEWAVPHCRVIPTPSALPRYTEMKRRSGIAKWILIGTL